MPKLIKQIIPIGLLSILLILSIFLWLNKDNTELYWNFVRFKLRHLPTMRASGCHAIRRMVSLSSQKNVDTKFLEKDYPNFLPRDKPLTTDLPERDYQWSEYQIDRIALAPGGYVVAEIYEYQRLPQKQTGITTIHTVAYKKNAAGEYSQVENCRKYYP